MNTKIERMCSDDRRDIESVSFGKALGLTIFVIAIGMTEKLIYKIQKFFKK